MSRSLSFTKMHGAGNDFVLFDGLRQTLPRDLSQLARDIAAKFNNDYGINFFPQPEPLILTSAARVMSLRDGTKKMSKSDASDNSRINMTDDAGAIAAKIRKAKTDPDALPDSLAGLEGRPEAANLMGIYAALTDKSIDDVCVRYGGQMFSTFKQRLADRAVSVLVPIQDEMRRLMDDTACIDAVLHDGAERARVISRPILEKIYDVVGFLRP